MTPEITPFRERLRIAEKNMRLHRLLGWKRHNLHPAYWTKGDPDGLVPDLGDLVPMPDYCRDLNAVHSILGSISDYQTGIYWSQLQGKLGDWRCIDASAKERVDAIIFALTLNTDGI